MKSRYVDWLQKQGVQLYKVGSEYWRMYQSALVPASISPCYIEIDHAESASLLKKSGALFMRYSSDPCEHKTEWWYIICDTFDSEKRSAKTRQNINRGKRSCEVRLLDAEWVAHHGYECYFSAFSRYKNADPDSEEVFRRRILSTVGGPFVYWGVFVKGSLAGYCKVILDGNDAITDVTKYSPEFLRHRTTYALIDGLIQHYVIDNKMVLSNGNRSILHDTSYQDVLINIGFRKQFCRLNIVYKPWVEYIVKFLYSIRRPVNSLSDSSMMIHKLRAILYQEELRRTFSK